MGPECDGMVQTDFFDGAMAVLLEHPDVYLAGSAKRESLETQIARPSKWKFLQP